MSVEAPTKFMDVVFLIDATGSMSSTLKAAHDKAAEIAIDLRVQNPDVDFRFGSVCYRDPIDSPGDVHQVQILSSDIDSLVAFLATVDASGGADTPEDWVGAYDLALNQIQWRSGAKTIVHIADAPAHGERYCGVTNHEEETPKLAPLIERVARQGILVTALNLNAGATLSFTECKTVYDAAGGRRYAIESFAVQGGWGDDEKAAPCRKRASRAECGKKTRRASGDECGKKKRKASRAEDDDELETVIAPPPSASARIAAKLADATASTCHAALAMEYV
jgi:hypothetical protein